MSKIIGIDLGTTNSAMAVVIGNEPEIIRNQEGANTTPSVVAANLKTKERFVGELARRQAITNPENTIFSVKRFIGKKFSDKQVQAEAKRLPFKIVKHGSDDGVGVVLQGKTHAPAEISAMVLRKLKEDAEKHLGEKVTQAVITVPAYFNDVQREATKAAGKIAGLEVLRIINEPTAAALAYDPNRREDAKRKEEAIVVYDLGGGTFDVTVLQIGESVFEVQSTNGDTHLGGDDFDQRVIDHIADEFKRENGIDLRGDPAAHQRVRVEAERAKKDLSTLTQTDISLPFITADASGPKHLQMVLTRAKLEELTSDLIERTVEPTQKALKDANISPKDIDEIILVGGMTRMPAVVEKVKKLFSKEPNTSINPDEVVALGAAIQAGVLQGDIKDVLLLDVTPLTLGIETLGGVRTPLIERNTTIPTSKTETFSTAADNQPSVEIHVVQGERELVRDNISIGRFTLDGILPAPRGVPKIDVTFDIDRDGILTVSAKDQASSKEQHITITGRSGLSDEEVDRLMKEAEANAEVDKQRRENIDARNLAESGSYAAEKLLKESGDKVPDEMKSDIEAKIQAVKDLLANEDSSTEDIKSSSEALQTALTQLGQAAYGQTPGADAADGADSAGQGDSTSGSDGEDGDDTVEGEYKEV